MEKEELKFEKYVPYEVDFDYINEKIDFLLTIPNEEPQKKSFWEIINFFNGKKIIERIKLSFFDTIRFESEDIEYFIKCKNLMAREILSISLNLQNEKKSLWCEWYFYDIDTCTEIPQAINYFFLANELKILEEKVTISTSIMNEYDPNILVESSLFLSPCGKPLWSNMKANQRALAKWYFQKFYQETVTGQILFLRENSSLPNPFTNYSNPNKSPILSSIKTYLKYLLIVGVLILLKMLF